MSSSTADVGRNAMKQRVRWIAAATLGAAAAAGLIYWATRPRLHDAPLANVPAGSAGALVVHPAKVMSSALWDEMVRKPGRDAHMKEVEKKCGMNPLQLLDQITVFVTGETADDLKQVGYLGHGHFDREKLVRCVSRVIEGDGGSVRHVEVMGMPAVAGGSGDSRALFYGADAVIGGDEDLVKRTIGTIRGGPSLATERDVSDLWRRVAMGTDVAGVFRIPTKWRGAIRSFVERLGPGLAELGSAQTAAVGISLADGVALRVALGFANDGQAQAVTEGIQSALASLLTKDPIRLSVAGPVLKAAQVAHDANVSTLRLEVHRGELSTLFELLARQPGPPALPGPPPSP